MITIFVELPFEAGEYYEEYLKQVLAKDFDRVCEKKESYLLNVLYYSPTGGGGSLWWAGKYPVCPQIGWQLFPPENNPNIDPGHDYSNLELTLGHNTIVFMDMRTSGVITATLG